MNGIDRRTAAACPCLAAHSSLRTTTRTTGTSRRRPYGPRPAGGTPTAGADRRVPASVRLRGHQLGPATAAGAAGESATPRRAPVEAVHREPHTGSTPRSTATPPARRGRAGRARVPAGTGPRTGR